MFPTSLAGNTSSSAYCSVFNSGHALINPQVHISDDDFLSLMLDDGTMKDDVKKPDGEVGDKIEKLFRTDEKDTSKSQRK